MEANGRTNWKCVKAACVAAAIGTAAIGCGGSGYYYDPYYYGYDYYYPADMAYAGAYYADPVYGGVYYASAANSTQTTKRALLGKALRDLASGQDICPGHVTLSTMPGAPGCDLGRKPI